MLCLALGACYDRCSVHQLARVLARAFARVREEDGADVDVLGRGLDVHAGLHHVSSLRNVNDVPFAIKLTIAASAAGLAAPMRDRLY